MLQDEIKKELKGIIAFDEEEKLNTLLNGDTGQDVIQYLAKMSLKDPVVLSLRVYEASAPKCTKKLYDYMPAAVIVNKFERSLKPILFSRLQRHANTLRFMSMPEVLVNKVFTFVYGDQDEQLVKTLAEAAKGTIKPKLD